MEKALFVMVAGDVPKDANVIKTIYRLNGEVALVLFD